MERYDEYKDSGVEWIGEIPKCWRSLKLKDFGRIERGHGIQRSDVIKNGRPCVRYGELYTTYDQRIVQPISYVSDELFRSCVKLHPDELAVAITGETKEDIAPAAVNLSGVDLAIGGDMLRFSQTDSDGRFLSYAINSQYFKRQMSARAHGEIIVHVGADTVSVGTVVLPPKSEQVAIADYLDEKTEKIDALIAETEKSIGLLEEYRRSVISEAVTKGIDPDAPMNDSGIEWLGEIPEGWAVRPSKSLFRESKALRFADDIRCAATQQFGIISQAEYVERTGSRVVQADKNLDSWKHVVPGDFVISLRSFQGGIEFCGVTGCVTWHYIVLKPDEEIKDDYYRYLLKSRNYIKALQRTCTYIRDGQDLRYSNFVQVPLPYPPLEEQLAIGSYLNERTSLIDALIVRKQELVDKLRSYRKSLISEAVTGKFKVPGSEEGGQR